MEKNSMRFIYALCDPISGAPRYIGQSKNPKKRYLGHIAAASSEETIKSRWIMMLRYIKEKPRLLILDEVEREKADESEMRWIKRMMRRFPLTNSKIGSQLIVKKVTIHQDKVISTIALKTRGPIFWMIRNI